VYLVEAAELDADMRTHGFTPRSETATVHVESEWGRRVSVNGLYVQQGSAPSRPLVILKTGTTHDALRSEAGDFEDWILKGVGRPDLEVVVKHTTEVEGLPSPGTVAGVVITPSHDMVTDEPAWLGAVVAWLRAAVEASVPTLGICYGHQLLARALGGQVGYNPRGREVGTVSVELLPDGKADPLLGVMPAVFPVQASHSQSVLVLPEGATPLARSENEENHAFRVGSCAWGLQFHPEFSEAVMRRYIELEADELQGEGLNADELGSSVKPSLAERLLGAFGELL
jgi:GMP synthase (glutamine-hydrolysing)